MKTLKPAALASIIVLTSGVVLAEGTSTGSATLDVNGAIANRCDVTITSNNVTLDLVNGANDVAVASVSEFCNKRSGYNVTLSSANDGVLKDGSETVAYTVNYDTLSASSLATDQSVSRNEPGYDDAYTLAINVDPDDNRAAGAYSDTITVTVTMK